MKNLPKIVVAVFIVFICLVLVSGFGTSSTMAAPPTAQTMPGGLLEMRLIDDPRPIRIPAPTGFDPKRRAPNAAPIVVNYVSTGRFGDTCTTWPSGAQTAFAYAASLASALFNSSVTTTIDACWVTNFSSSNILGHGGAINYRAGFAEAPVTNTWYADALANALHGSDFDSANHEIYIGYNANRSDWYYGTDGIPGSTKIDLVSVAFHEMFHGLGFIPSFSYSGGTGSWGLEVSPPYHPAAYDRFVYNGSGQLLITAFTNPSIALGSQLVSNNLFFNGPYTNAANGGNPAKIFAPNPGYPLGGGQVAPGWMSGSSIAHLDWNVFSANELMVYAIGAGQSKHSPGPVSLGVMKDIGWATGAPPATTKVYLPLVLNNPPAQTGPTPGYWASSTGDEFYVTLDRAYVKNFAIYLGAVGSCSSVKITHTVQEPISNNSFSFSGSFYGSGTFDSATTAHGSDGLNHFPLPPCGVYVSGSWTYNATWQNGSQAIVSSVVTVDPDIIEQIAASGDFHTATIDK